MKSQILKNCLWYGSVSKPCTHCSSHQNSWDLWMFIPLKMVLIGIDPYPYSTMKNPFASVWTPENLHLPTCPVMPPAIAGKRRCARHRGGRRRDDVLRRDFLLAEMGCEKSLKNEKWWKMDHSWSICQLSYTFLGLGYFIPTFEGKHIEVMDAEDMKRERSNFTSISGFGDYLAICLIDMWYRWYGKLNTHHGYYCY